MLLHPNILYCIRVRVRGKDWVTGLLPFSSSPFGERIEVSGRGGQRR